MGKKITAFILTIALFCNMAAAFASNLEAVASADLPSTSSIAPLSVDAYGDYVYSNDGDGVYVVDFGDIANPVLHDSFTSEYMKQGTYGTDQVNKHVYVYDNVLYTSARIGSESYINCFDISENPTDPAFIKRYRVRADALYMQAADNTLYVCDGSGFDIINLETDEVNYYSVSGGAKSFRIVGDNLCAVQNGKIYMFNRNEKNVISSKEITTSTGAKRTLLDVEIIGNYAVITAYTTNWMKRNIGIIDISEPDNLESKDIKWMNPADELSRVGSMKYKNGILYVADMDAYIYMYDASSFAGDNPKLSLLTKKQGSNNYYEMSVSGNRIYLSSLGKCIDAFEIEFPEISCEKEQQSYTNPVEITGKALGQNTVTAVMNGIQKTADVDNFGMFCVKFDDEFIPNGTYTAVITDDSDSSETEIKVTLEHGQRISVNDDYDNGKISIHNNTNQAENIILYDAAFKDNTLVLIDTRTEVLNGYGDLEFNGLSLSGDYDYSKTYIVKEKNGKPVFVWESAARGNEDTQTPQISVNGDEIINIAADCIHSEKRVNVGISVKTGIEKIFVMVTKPDGDIEYVTAVDTSESEGRFSFNLSEPATADADYTIIASIPYIDQYISANTTFRYYSNEVISDILQKLDEAESTSEYYSILENNKEKLSIDISAYQTLGEIYKEKVIESLMENRYYESGSIVLKNDWNNAVAGQKHQQSYDNTLNDLNNINSYDDFTDLFANHYDIIKTDLETHKYFSLLDDDNKNEICHYLRIGEYESVEEFISDFETAAALLLINQSDSADIETNLMLTKDTLGITLATDFDKLSAVQKGLFYKQITESKYSSADELRNAVSEAIKYAGSINSSVYTEYGASYALYQNANQNFYSIAEYKGYAYTSTASGIKVIDFNVNPPVEVTNAENSGLILGTSQSSAVNRYVYVKDGYLYAAVEQDNAVRKYSLENPADPVVEETYYLQNKGSIAFIEADGSYLYIAHGSAITIINMDTNAANIISRTAQVAAFRCSNGYLYGISKGVMFIYDVSDMNNPRLLGSKALTYTDTNGETKERTVADIEIVNRYAVITSYSTNWMKRDIWIIDISNPEKLSSQTELSIGSGDTFSRVGAMTVKNGLLFVASIDNNLYIYDITQMPVMTKVTQISYSDKNPYTIQVNDRNIYIATANSQLMRQEYRAGLVTIDTETVEQRPIEIKGKAIGQSSVSVKLGNAIKTSDVDRYGNYSVMFDNDFIPDGTYTAEAVSVSDSYFSASRQVKVNVGDMYSVSAEYSETTAEINLTNNADEFAGAVILAGYKDNKMSDYSYEEFTAGTSVQSELTLSDTNYDYVKAYIIKKSGQGYTLIWNKILSGESTLPISAVNENESAYVECDVHNELKKADITVSAPQDAGEKLILVIRPEKMGLEGLEYIETLDKDAGKLQFALNDLSENKDFTVMASIKTSTEYLYANNTFRYFGETIITPILEQVKDSSIDTIEGILAQYMTELAVDLSDSSDYAQLNEAYYKNKVLKSVIKDYVQNGGSVQLKLDFNNAVAVQKKEKQFNSDLSAALTQLEGVSDREDFERMIEQNPVLNIDVSVTGNYASLTDESKDKVFAAINANTYTMTYDTAHEDARKLYNDFVTHSAVEYINQTAYDKLGDVLEAVSGFINLNYSDTFKNFSSTNKLYVYKEIARNDYTSCDAVQNAIDSATEYVYNTYVKNQIVSGGSGISSNSSHSYTPKPSVQPEDTEQKDINTGVTFDDLDGFDWAKEEIEYLAANGVISGRGDGIFAPADAVTRQEFVKMVVTAFGYTKATEIKFGFTDVDTAGWSAGYIQAAVDNNIVSGITQNSFAPENTITRQDMAAILYRVLIMRGCTFENTNTDTLRDYDKISEYCREAAGALYNSQIIFGTEENLFSPLECANRAMAARLIYACINYTNN